MAGKLAPSCRVDRDLSSPAGPDQREFVGQARRRVLRHGQLESPSLGAYRSSSSAAPGAGLTMPRSRWSPDHHRRRRAPMRDCPGCLGRSRTHRSAVSAAAGCSRRRPAGRAPSVRRQSHPPVGAQISGGTQKAPLARPARPATQRTAPSTSAHPVRASDTARSTMSVGLPHSSGNAGSTSERRTVRPGMLTSASVNRFPTRPEASSTRSQPVPLSRRVTLGSVARRQRDRLDSSGSPSGVEAPRAGSAQP